MKVRRVVTGHDARGKSVVVSDELIESVPIPMGIDAVALWGRDDPPTFPDDGYLPAEAVIPATAGEFRFNISMSGRRDVSLLRLPPAGGFRFAMLTVPATGVSADSSDTAAAAKIPGFHFVTDQPDSLFHRTDTLDLLMVMSGEIDMEFEEGPEVHLKAGDTLIQNGTTHLPAHNRSGQPVVLLVCQIGTFNEEAPRSLPSST